VQVVDRDLHERRTAYLDGWTRRTQPLGDFSVRIGPDHYALGGER
jgi:exoribonuclease II